MARAEHAPITLPGPLLLRTFQNQVFVWDLTPDFQYWLTQPKHS